jgi:catechol 2,3-dioxygenase-like lactoylglutathione lyase family enzyme
MTAMPPPAGDPALATTALRAFVPGGRDYEKSKAFYRALGFTMTFDAGEVAGFACDSGAFLLQNHYHEGWAGNFMLQLLVADLDAWWAHVEGLDLPAAFGVPPPRAPAVQPWGMRVAYLVGPCGELWHVAQDPDRA